MANCICGFPHCPHCRGKSGANHVMNYIKLSPRNRFLHFIKAREAMRVHKELIGGPGPHSDDPLLANHRFCNINREHDTVTKFIHLAFRVPFYSRGKQFMVRQMLFCRIFNQPDVLQQVCPFADKMDAAKRLKAYRNQGHKMMRGAYMMPPHGKNVGGTDIIDHWLEVVELATGTDFMNWPAVKRTIDYERMDKLSQVAEGLMTVCGVGAFIANQVCTDLRYVPVWGHEWKDWQSFILCGPGTRRGMHRFDGGKIEGNVVPNGSDEAFTIRLLTIREELMPDLPQSIKDYYRDPNNLSNSFCEFDKYERATFATEDKQVSLRKWVSDDESNGQLSLL